MCSTKLTAPSTGFRTDKENLPDDVKYYLGRIHSLDGSEPPEEERISSLVSRIVYWLQSEEPAGAGPAQMGSPGPGAGEIRSTALVHNTNFVGREEELQEMHRLLRGENNKLFLFGAGGMGKSELARQYLRKFQGEYATLVWLTYNTDIQEMLISDQFLLIRGLESEKQDLTTPQAREAYYEKKLNYLKEHCNSDTLLVVDNLDMQDPRLSQLLEGRYSMIITSRISREKEGYQELAVQPLNRWEDQLALFKKFAGGTGAEGGVSAHWFSHLRHPAAGQANAGLSPLPHSHAGLSARCRRGVPAPFAAGDGPCAGGYGANFRFEPSFSAGSFHFEKHGASSGGRGRNRAVL